MFFKMNADRSFAYADGVQAAAKADSFARLLSSAFLVMFDDRAVTARKRRDSVKRRDAEFDRFVDAHGPFTRYLP